MQQGRQETERHVRNSLFKVNCDVPPANKGNVSNVVGLSASFAVVVLGLARCDLSCF
jgi:hypothetical protein